MIRGKTESGFEFSVSEKIKNDYRFIRAYRKSRSNDEDEQLIGTDDLLTVVLGEDGAEALCKHLAEEDGTVPTDKVMSELAEILKVIGTNDQEIKN